MLAAGRGSIINTASMMSFVADAGRAPYSAGKHAILGLTEAAGTEVAASGVRVNAVCPGPIDTQMSRRISADLDPADPVGSVEQIAAETPAGRYGRPAPAPSPRR